jgi:putative membrane protein
MMGGSGGGSMWLWFVLVLLGLLLIGYVAVRLLSSGRSDAAAAGQAPRTARDILDERYARGEIDDQEYRARRETLQ